MEFNPFTLYLIVAIALIATELIIFQFSFFWFLFIGLGALITALAALIFPEISWLSSTALFVVSSAGLSVALYRPLKRWQDKPGIMPGNDAIGQRVKVLDAISLSAPGRVEWSGTDWKAELAEGCTDPIDTGSNAVIVELEGIRLTVKPA